MSNPLLEAKNLTKTFRVATGKPFDRHHFVALSDVSLKLYPGKTMGLIGESGCGKSTLGHILARIMEPDSGEVIMDGVTLTEHHAPFDRHSIQMVLQDPNGALNPSRRVRWILHEALRAKKIDHKVGRDRIIAQMIPRVGLEVSYLDRYPHELSGGQKQRVAILLAILMEPRVIIADEVVSSLDVSVRSQILNLLRELQAAMGLGYLFISHDLNIVYYMSHTIAVMYLGEIVEEGSADEVYHRGRHPYTRLLLNSLLDYEGKGGQVAGHIMVEKAGEISGDARTEQGCRFAGRCPRREDVCIREKPAFVNLGEGHRVRCHFAREEKP